MRKSIRVSVLSRHLIVGMIFVLGAGVTVSCSTPRQYHAQDDAGSDGPGGGAGNSAGGSHGPGSGGSSGAAGGVTPASGGSTGTAGAPGSGGTSGTAGALGSGGTSGGSGGRGFGDSSTGGTMGSGGSGTGGSGAKANGVACGAGAECASGVCSEEGVCCNSACSGQCESCTSTASNGTCVAVTTPRTPCPGTGTCAGHCDGTNRTGCVFPSTTTSCGAAASCAGGVATTAGLCNGAGVCTPSAMMTCTLGCQSGGTGCLSKCPDGQKQCNSACIPNAQCCGDCSGNTPVCSNGVCVGKANGESCTGTGSDCASGVCSAEGVCCNAACSGQCESCLSPSNRGTCVPVTTPRTPCTGSGTCGGTCNGVTRASCVYPGSSTTCAAASCTNGMARASSSCDGNGLCVAPSPTVCNYGCVPGTLNCSQCRQPTSGVNLLSNPGFDGSAQGWAAAGMYYSGSNDADDCNGSGSGDLTTGFMPAIDQCVNATAGTYYFTYLFKPAAVPNQMVGDCHLEAMPISCPNVFSDSIAELRLMVDSAGGWVRATETSFVAPAGTASLHVYCVAEQGYGYYDQIYLGKSSTTVF